MRVPQHPRSCGQQGPLPGGKTGPERRGHQPPAPRLTQDQGQAFPTAQSAQSLPGPASGVPALGSPQGLPSPPEAGMTSGSERAPHSEAGAGKASPGVGAERGSMTGREPRPVTALPLASPASGETPWFCPSQVLATFGPLWPSRHQAKYPGVSQADGLPAPSCWRLSCRSPWSASAVVCLEVPCPHLSTWRIPWTEEPGGLQSMGSQSDAIWRASSAAQATEGLASSPSYRCLGQLAPVWNQDGQLAPGHHYGSCGSRNTVLGVHPKPYFILIFSTPSLDLSGGTGHTPNVQNIALTRRHGRTWKLYS